MTKCNICKGTGKTRNCTYCYHNEADWECEFCDGNGNVLCTNCNGSGEQ